MNSNNNNNYKASLIYILYKIAQADNDEHIHETAFIQEVAHKLGFSNKELIEIKSNDEFEVSIPKNEHDRIYFFFHALQLVEIDNKILKQEVELLKQIGFKLGINPLLVIDLVNLYISKITQTPNSQDVSDILKKYMN